MYTIDENKLYLSKLRKWKDRFVSGAKALKSSLFPTANTIQILSIIFLRFIAPFLLKLHSQLQGCIMDLCVCSPLLHFEAGVRQSLEVEVKLTFPCVGELSLLQCTVEALMEWILQ